MRCPGHVRHWFSLYGVVGLRLPVCVRCPAPNPRPLSAEELADIRSFVRDSPEWVPSHVRTAVDA